MLKRLFVKNWSTIVTSILYKNGLQNNRSLMTMGRENTFKEQTKALSSTNAKSICFCRLFVKFSQGVPMPLFSCYNTFGLK